ncbi:MAG: alpha/beta hydrolase [Saprospiraceae bacterium]|nr:alpha/beta hydrolase [Saprospiraceae bacterium]
MKKYPLLLLHGALGAAEQFDTLQNHLAGHYDVHTLDFSGHGTDDFAGHFSMSTFVDDVLKYMDQNKLGQCDIFGFSMGGFVAVSIATQYPDKIHSIMTLGTKWSWDEVTALKETKMLDPEVILQKVPDFARTLEQRHSGSAWKSVLSRTAALMTDLGREGGIPVADLNKLDLPVHICLGSEDRMVTREESVFVAGHIPGAHFALLADTPHPLEKVNMKLLAGEIRKWFR